MEHWHPVNHRCLIKWLNCSDNSLISMKFCVISGGKFEQFETQLLGNLEASEDELAHLHIMPTCGTRYYLYNPDTKHWKLQYAEDFTEEEKQKIISVVNETVRESVMTKLRYMVHKLKIGEARFLGLLLGKIL